MADISIVNVHSLSSTQPLLHDLAEILMEVDPFIYPALFADEAHWEDVLSRLASLDESPLACEHWRVATVDGRVAGICVRQVRRMGSMGEEWRELGLGPSFSDACDRYLSGICDDTADGSVYVMALATHPDFRRRGIGRALLDDAIMSPGATTGAYLDVLASNAPAIRLYEGLGFRVYDEVDGYAYGRPAPHVLRMARIPDDLTHRSA